MTTGLKLMTVFNQTCRRDDTRKVSMLSGVIIGVAFPKQLGVAVLRQ